MARSCVFKIRITDKTYHRFLVSLQTWQLAERLGAELEPDPKVVNESWGLDFGAPERIDELPENCLSVTGRLSPTSIFAEPQIDAAGETFARPKLLHLLRKKPEKAKS
jgi:hypothetical protein